MKYSTARTGRTFVLRLEDGDILHESIEQFAREQHIECASLQAVGGIDQGSLLVVGPVDGRSAPPIEPQEITVPNVYEVTGTGTLFPDKDGQPIVHMHLACGRGSDTLTGCTRRGVRVWHVLEVILTELVDCPALRLKDEATGFDLLQPRGL